MKGQLDNMQLVLGVLILIVLMAAVFYIGPDFETMLANLQARGFFSFVLPFILVFTVVYAILRSTKVVDNITALIIALVAALFSLLFLSTVPVVGFLAYFLGRIGIVIVILVVVYMFYAYMSREEKK